MKYRIKFEVSCEDCDAKGVAPININGIDAIAETTCSGCNGTGFQEENITKEINGQQQNLITALKLGCITWFQFFTEWRKTDED